MRALSAFVCVENEGFSESLFQTLSSAGIQALYDSKDYNRHTQLDIALQCDVIILDVIGKQDESEAILLALQRQIAQVPASCKERLVLGISSLLVSHAFDAHVPSYSFPGSEKAFDIECLGKQLSTELPKSHRVVYFSIIRCGLPYGIGKDSLFVTYQRAIESALGEGEGPVLPLSDHAMDGSSVVPTVHYSAILNIVADKVSYWIREVYYVLAELGPGTPIPEAIVGSICNYTIAVDDGPLITSGEIVYNIAMNMGIGKFALGPATQQPLRTGLHLLDTDDFTGDAVACNSPNALLLPTNSFSAACLSAAWPPLTADSTAATAGAVASDADKSDTEADSPVAEAEKTPARHVSPGRQPLTRKQSGTGLPKLPPLSPNLPSASASPGLDAADGAAGSMSAAPKIIPVPAFLTHLRSGEAFANYLHANGLKVKRIVVVGPPACGKKTFARALATLHNLPLVTVSSALSWIRYGDLDVLSGRHPGVRLELDELRKEVEVALAESSKSKMAALEEAATAVSTPAKGRRPKKDAAPTAPQVRMPVVPPSTKIPLHTLARVIKAVLMSPSCRVAGWVLAGYPRSMAEAQYLFGNDKAVAAAAVQSAPSPPPTRRKNSISSGSVMTMGGKKGSGLGAAMSAAAQAVPPITYIDEEECNIRAVCTLQNANIPLPPVVDQDPLRPHIQKATIRIQQLNSALAAAAQSAIEGEKKESTREKGRRGSGDNVPPVMPVVSFDPLGPSAVDAALKPTAVVALDGGKDTDLLQRTLSTISQEVRQRALSLVTLPPEPVDPKDKQAVAAAAAVEVRTEQDILAELNAAIEDRFHRRMAQFVLHFGPGLVSVTPPSEPEKAGRGSKPPSREQGASDAAGKPPIARSGGGSNPRSTSAGRPVAAGRARSARAAGGSVESSVDLDKRLDGGIPRVGSSLKLDAKSVSDEFPNSEFANSELLMSQASVADVREEDISESQREEVLSWPVSPLQFFASYHVPCVLVPAKPPAYHVLVPYGLRLDAQGEQRPYTASEILAQERSGALPLPPFPSDDALLMLLASFGSSTYANTSRLTAPPQESASTGPFLGPFPAALQLQEACIPHDIREKGVLAQGTTLYRQLTYFYEKFPPLLPLAYNQSAVSNIEQHKSELLAQAKSRIEQERFQLFADGPVRAELEKNRRMAAKKQADEKDKQERRQLLLAQEESRLQEALTKQRQLELLHAILPEIGSALANAAALEGWGGGSDLWNAVNHNRIVSHDEAVLDTLYTSLDNLS